MLFDGHFIWVQKDLICACSFCWQESPDGPETKKLEEVFENVKREKFDFFQSFENLDETFHPYPPPAIPYEKEIKKSKFLLSALAYDAGQKMLMLNHVGTYNCRKTPIIYSDKQRNKYVLTCNPSPLYPEPLVLPDSVDESVEAQLKVFTAKVLETSLQSDLETNTAEEPKAEPAPRASRASGRRASTGGRKRRRLLEDGDYEAPQSAQHTTPGAPRANRKSVSQGNGTPGLAALLRATEEADAREIERPPIEEEDDEGAGAASPTAPAPQDVGAGAQLAHASPEQAAQAQHPQDALESKPLQQEQNGDGSAGAANAGAVTEMAASEEPVHVKEELKVEGQEAPQAEMLQVTLQSGANVQIQAQPPTGSESGVQPEQLDVLYNLGSGEQLGEVAPMTATHDTPSAPLPTNLQIPQMLQTQTRKL